MDNQAPIKLPKTSESDHLKRIRHTTSHVMAMAVQKLFPQAQVTIGPWTETRFYYDFDVLEPFTDRRLILYPPKRMGGIFVSSIPRKNRAFDSVSLCHLSMWIDILTSSKWLWYFRGGTV